jgi:hypothetical protein
MEPDKSIKSKKDPIGWVLMVLILGYALWPLWVIPLIALKLFITGTL